jgi:hypothetical protein
VSEGGPETSVEGLGGARFGSPVGAGLWAPLFFNYLFSAKPAAFEIQAPLQSTSDVAVGSRR